MKKRMIRLLSLAISAIGISFSPTAITACTKLDPSTDDWKWVIKPGDYDCVDRSMVEGMIIIRKGNKFGFVDSTGKLAIEPQFDDAYIFGRGVAPVMLNNKVGLIDKKGKLILTPQFDGIGYFTEKYDLAEVILNGKSGLINLRGQIVIEPQFDYVGRFSENLCVVETEGKRGCIDTTGRIVIDPIFDNVRDFYCGFAIFHINDKWGLMDKTGKIIVEHCDLIDNSDPCYITTKKNGKFGIITRDGEVMYSEVLDAIYGLGRDLLKVKIGNKYGFVNFVTKYISPIVFDELSRSSNSLVTTSKHSKWGMVDPANGKTIVEAEYDELPRFFRAEKLAITQLNNKKGLINTDGRIIAPPKYDAITYIDSEYLTVGANGKYGIIDSTGKVVIGLHYNDLECCNDGLVAAKINNKWGYIDLNDKIVIEPQFEGGGYFTNGLALVEVGGRMGGIDESGTFVIKAQYDAIRRYDEGVMSICVDDKWGFMHPSGKVAIEPQFSSVAYWDQYWIVFLNGKKGVVDTMGKLVVAPNYDQVDMLSTQYYTVQLKDKYGLIDSAGNVIVETEYDDPIYRLDGTILITKNDKQGIIDHSSGKLLQEAKFDRIESMCDNQKLHIVRAGDKWGALDQKGEIVLETIYDGFRTFDCGVMGLRKKGKWGLADFRGRVIIEPQFDKLGETIDGGVLMVMIDRNVGYIALSAASMLPPDKEALQD